MGADLIISHIIVKDETLDDWKRRIDNTIDNITLETHEEEIKFYLDDVLFEEAEEFGKEDVERFKERAKLLVSELVNCIENGYRDTSEIYVNENMTIYLTGGMSWGDSPTDSFDTFEKVSRLMYDVLDME